jgi:hypothetical protein
MATAEKHRGVYHLENSSVGHQWQGLDRVSAVGRGRKFYCEMKIEGWMVYGRMQGFKVVEMVIAID